MSLHAISGYDELVRYYQANHERPWDEWLEVLQIFPHPGKQGLVGLMKAKGESKVIYVFKISQYINYLPQHEYAVGSGLIPLTDYCPHFCRVVGVILCRIDPEKRKEGNPFHIESKYSVEKEVLLMEHIPYGHKFYNYIISSRLGDEAIYAQIRQVLLGIAMAQNSCSFTHYDLHSNNIMLRKCSRKLVYLYVFDHENQFCVPTHGYYPVVIDYGFAYSNGLIGQSLWPTLNHTEIGFICDRHDPVSDGKLFLITVSDELRKNRSNSLNRRFRSVVKDLYGELNVDWSSGWDRDSRYCVMDYVLQEVTEESDSSPLFKEYEYFCFDLIQTLITAPMKSRETGDIVLAYRAFLDEFIKIENQISSPFYGLYILKGIVDSARQVKDDYRSPDLRMIAVGFFRLRVLEHIDSVSQYCRPKDLNWEKMLCSLLCLAENMEGILYEALHRRTKSRQSQYQMLPFSSMLNLVSSLEVNFPQTYHFTPDNIVMVIDAQKRSCLPYTLSSTDCEELNKLESISWGPWLYQLTVKNLPANKCLAAEVNAASRHSTTPGQSRAMSVPPTGSPIPN